MKLPEPVENLLHRFRRENTADSEDVKRLRAEIDLLRAQQKSIKEESLAAAYQNLFADLSSPISQLLLQLHIANSAQNNTLAASDVLVHVKRLVAALEQHGLSVAGQPDEIQNYDPNLHESLSPQFAPSAGQPVRICFPGISYNGQLLRKAAVEAPEAE